MSPQLSLLLNTGLHILFYVLTLVFVFFSVFTIYHWFTYGSSKHISSFSLAIYLVVSAPLFITMAIVLSLI
jgi:hypothetical protein